MIIPNISNTKTLELINLFKTSSTNVEYRSLMTDYNTMLGFVDNEYYKMAHDTRETIHIKIQNYIIEKLINNKIESIQFNENGK